MIFLVFLAQVDHMPFITTKTMNKMKNLHPIHPSITYIFIRDKPYKYKNV